MYGSTLSAAEASARPMRESRTQLPARSLDLRDERARPRFEFRAARYASATASRYPSDAHRAATSCDLGARCAVRALYGSPEAGCLSISRLYAVTAQPFDAQQLL